MVFHCDGQWLSVAGSGCQWRSVAQPYDVYWKVLNRGDVARNKNCIRGQIIKDDGLLQRIEYTSFLGDHIVECYCVKDGVVVAKNRIHVPISGGRSNDD